MEATNEGLVEKDVTNSLPSNVHRKEAEGDVDAQGVLDIDSVELDARSSASLNAPDLGSDHRTAYLFRAARNRRRHLGEEINAVVVVYFLRDQSVLERPSREE
jgi:hypothetical protein